MTPRAGMRVLMSTDTVGGVWMYALELARALEPLGVQVVLATLGKSLTPAQRRQAGQVPSLILCESQYKLEWMDRPWRDVDRAGRWLLQLEQRYAPDVIHLNHYCHGHLDWRAPRVVVGHSCVLSWWQAVHGTAPPPEWTPYAERVQNGIRGADSVTAPSAAMLAGLERNYGPLPPSSVIHNGRSPAEYPGRHKASFVLGVGRLWDAGKNLATLARIAPDLSWPVYLAGETRHPDGGQIALDHVHAVGQLPPEALHRLYGHAAIYALPARYEPFGLSVLEAALAGCAPVLGDIPTLRELWDGAALFVPPDAPDQLRDTVNLLIEQPERREALAACAQRRAHRYTARQMADHYVNLYSGLLAASPVSQVWSRATS